MSLVAVWWNDENAKSPRIWIATDSRIADDEGILIDQGIKLYEVPVVCRTFGASGLFHVPFYATSIGIAAVGGSLIYQHVYGTVVPLLSNLVGAQAAPPSVADLARFVGAVATRYVRSLGAMRPSRASHVAIVVTGDSPEEREPQAYLLEPRTNADDLVEFSASRMTLAPNEVIFLGDRVSEATRLCQEVVRLDEPGAPRHRAALNVIRALINDPNAPTIGGEVQVGFTTGSGFRRVASVVPNGPPHAASLLNAIDLQQLPDVGGWMPGIDGMVVP